VAHRPPLLNCRGPLDLVREKPGAGARSRMPARSALHCVGATRVDTTSSNHWAGVRSGGCFQNCVMKFQASAGTQLVL